MAKNTKKVALTLTLDQLMELQDVLTQYMDSAREFPGVPNPLRPVYEMVDQKIAEVTK